MEMKLATRTQRLLVYFIDFVLPGIIVSNIILPLFYMLINFDASIINTTLNALKAEIEASLSNNLSDATRIYEYLMQYIKYFFVDLGFTILFTSIILAVYLLIVPKFWKKQTLGRMLLKVKVVKKNGAELSMKDILLREGIGVILMYVMLNNLLGGGIMFATIILAYVDGRSLADYIAGTCLITEKEIAGEYPNSPFRCKADDNVIDADVEDISNDNINDKSNGNDDEYTII